MNVVRESIDELHHRNYTESPVSALHMCSTLTNSSNLASISASKRSFPQIHQSMTFVVPEPQAPLKLSAVAQLSSNPKQIKQLHTNLAVGV